jgi:DNA-directed RNA polymerase specialized sigma24 family protein
MGTPIVTPENFEELLSWIDPDPEKTGVPDRTRGAVKYEAIRRRIIKIYQNRGCQQAEEIADETFNRVCVKVKELRKRYTGDPALYFYAVAKNVYREFTRGSEIPPWQSLLHNDSEEIELRMGFLDTCLDQLDSNERSLILKFYEGEKREKIENRKGLASELGINTKALSLRTLRIRRQLLDCMRKHLDESNSGK